jgi:TonB-linked SusC/RagA family outer membrane protein
MLLFTAAFIFLSSVVFGQRVTLNLKEVPLQQVLKEMNAQTGRQFFFKDELLEKAGKVSVSVRNMPLEDALALCFRNTSLTFSIVGSTIVVKEKAVPEKKTLQELVAFTIRGKVTDTSGTIVEGASISIIETKRTVVTDAGGDFIIEAKPGQTMLISNVGFEAQTKQITDAGMIRISLVPAASSLKAVELVNTGYQRLPKERSAGSFSTASNESFRNKSVSMNVIDRLEGLIPGLAVNYGSGNEKFLIRGLSSIQGSRSPLIVVDGVPLADFNQVRSTVNPEDVENVTVLRDATAASIWGAAAANGVIVITTRRGKNVTGAQKIKVRYSGFLSLKGRPDLDYYQMMNTTDFLAASKQVFSAVNNPWANVINSVGVTPIVPPHERIQYDLSRGLISQSVADARFDSLSKLNNRDQINQYLTQPSLLSNHTISLDGGSAFHTYYGSIAYTLDKSDTKNNLNRYQMNLRQVFTFSPAVKLDLISNLSFEKTNRFLLTGLPASNSNYLPYAMFADANGNPLSQAYLKRLEEFRGNSESLSRINLDYVPLNEPATTLNDQQALTARVNAGLTVKLWKGLSYEGRAQFQQGGTDGYEYYDQNSYRVRDERVFFTRTPAVAGGLPTYYLPTKGGHYLTNNVTSRGWTVRNQLNYDKVFAGKHQLNMIAGTELRSDLTKSVQTYRRGYDFQTLTYAVYNEDSLARLGVISPVNFLTGRTTSNLLSSKPVTYTEVERRFFSAYSNAAYTFDKKYTLNSSIRFDQSNLFGTNRSLQYKPIWSVGGAWNVSRESFFDVKAVDNLNLRLTYGLAGNAPNPGFAGPFDIVSASNPAYFSGMGIGYTILVPRNENIRWERTATVNAGIDFSLFDSRISGSVDVYKKSTTDLLGYQPVDPTSGWSFAYNNLGNLENRGIEIQLNTQNVSGKHFKWNTLFTISYNKNQINRLKTASPLTTSGKVNAQFVEGYSAFGVFAYDYKGLDSKGNPYSFKTNGTDTARRLAELTVNDLLYMGTSQPLWFGGITNQISYKQFSLSFLIVYNLGNVMRRDVNQYYTGRLANNIPVYFKDRWMKAGDEAVTDVPRYEGSTALNGLRYVNIYTQGSTNVVSAGYAKLRDLTLAYTLPKGLLSNVSMTDAQFYVQLNNVMLWRNNSFNIDPEYFNLNNGVRNAAMPAFYTIGFRTSFK